MTITIEDRVRLYFDWLKSSTVIKKGTEEWIWVQIPFLDKKNDYISIYVHPITDGFKITDDGETLEFRSLWHRTQIDKIKGILLGFDIPFDSDFLEKEESETEELSVEATAENFSQKFHNLLQAILAVQNI